MHFVEENSKKDTRTSLAYINEDKFILEELAIQRVALVPHLHIEVDIVISMPITVAPKNEDSQEREFRPTLPALSLEQRCGMMVRDMYFSLEAFRAQLDSKVRCCTKSGPPISKDCTKSHVGPICKELPTPSLDQVLNGLFEFQHGQCKQG